MSARRRILEASLGTSLAVGLFLAGCQGTAEPRLQPPPSVEAQVEPSPEESPPTPEPLEIEEERPQAKLAVMRPPQRRSKRNPFAGKRSRPKPPLRKAKPQRQAEAPAAKPKAQRPKQSKKRAPAKRPKPKKRKVTKRLSLGGKANYPKYKPERITDPRRQQANRPVEMAKARPEDAVPIHHPGVTILDYSELPWLDCCFVLEPNGEFEVFLITDVRDPILRRKALRVLSEWVWRPKRVNGKPVASQEFIRLRRRVTRGPR